MKDGSVQEINDVGLYYGCLNELKKGTKQIKDVEKMITDFENLQAYELCDALRESIIDFKKVINAGKNLR